MNKVHIISLSRFLLVVFNKSVQLHSESVFPSNVTVKTANALSYQYIMATEARNRFVGWGLKYTDLMEHNLIPQRNTGKGTVWEGFNYFQRAAMVTETLSGFCMSIDEKVEVKHAPPPGMRPVTPGDESRARQQARPRQADCVCLYLRDG